MKAKVAYLFLTYGDINHPRLWERYFQGHDDTTVICCHAADRDSVSTPFLKDNLIPYWVSTDWGKIGLVIAQLELTRHALRDPLVERLVLCSGSCVPIKTYSRAYDSLFEHDKSWLTMHRQYIARMSKVTHLDQASHRKNSQWVMLTRQHAMMLVRCNYISDFTRCVIPDEHYVGSVLVHMGQQEHILQREQTCARWHTISPVQMTPTEHSILTSHDIQFFRNSSSILARKFKADSDISERWNDIVA